MTQVKFTIESDIVSAFKTRCADEGVSMASVIKEWMKTRHPANGAKTRILTRPQRKDAVRVYIGLLEGVLENESQYRDSIPEQFTQRHETADHACEQLGEAIACLEDAY